MGLVFSIKFKNHELMKFDTARVPNGEKVLKWVYDLNPNLPNPGAENHLWGSSTASNMRCGENFIKSCTAHPFKWVWITFLNP